MDRKFSCDWVLWLMVTMEAAEALSVFFVGKMTSKAVEIIGLLQTDK